MYPKLIIDMKKLESNIDACAKITKDDGGCSMMIVTKCLCADRKVAEMIAGHPRVDYLADSRVENIKKYSDLMAPNGKESVLLRLPMMCEIEDLVKYVDVGATYYFNKNMSTYVDYIINQIDSDNKLGVGSDDTVAVGIVYQF